MSKTRLKSYVIGIRILGGSILATGVQGFFIFKDNLAYLYWPGLICAVIIFVILAYWSGLLLKKSNE